jgi:nucleoside-diphosphate-sugar epimerase
VQKNIPLPFGAIYNKRSLIALDNLVDFIICCINHPRAANEVFLISDNADLSTTELLKKIACAFNKRLLLFPIPISFFKILAKLSGKQNIINRLFHSLQIDSSKACTLLNWNPVTTPDKQLKKIADALLDEKII